MLEMINLCSQTSNSRRQRFFDSALVHIVIYLVQRDHWLLKRADSGMLDGKLVWKITELKFAAKELYNAVETSPGYTKHGLFSWEQLSTTELYIFFAQIVLPRTRFGNQTTFCSLSCAWQPYRARGVFFGPRHWSSPHHPGAPLFKNAQFLGVSQNITLYIPINNIDPPFFAQIAFIITLSWPQSSV